VRDLDKALNEIASIRTHLARGTEFRGYGPVSLALTALVAVIAAGLQSVFVPEPAKNLLGYLGVWVATAVVCVVIIGIEAVTRSKRVHSALADDMIWLAVEQFLPAASAGVLLTVVLERCAPETLWMLPGLWQIVLSLGIFASCRSLPRPLIAMAVWYMATGLACLVLAREGSAFSPYAMALPFGLGQSLAAGLLRWVSARE
jgi:hypothetical protein